MLTLKVEGMSCGHCVRAVTEAVQEAVPGAGVQVDLGAGWVRVDGPAAPEAVAHAIEEAGYRVGSDPAA